MKEHDFLSELMYTASIMDIKIEMQTYIKVQLDLFYAEQASTEEVSTDKDLMLRHFYSLFAKDCPGDFAFGCKMIDEHILQKTKQNNKPEKEIKKKRKKNSNSHYKNDSSGTFTLDHTKFDPQDETLRKNSYS